jgi:hypothetical protein
MDGIARRSFLVTSAGAAAGHAAGTGVIRAGTLR